jgi:branched-subunit amino acid permease
MKKIKWHKFLIVAFMIWAGNKVVAVIGGVFRPYAIAIILFLIIIIFESCGSHCSRSINYWRNHSLRYLQTKIK